MNFKKTVGWRLLCLLALSVASAAALAQTAPTATTSTPPGSAQVFVQTGHSQMATMARFSPDGQRIATCDGAGPVIGWDAASGRQFREIHHHVGMCLGLAFTPDGERVLSSGGPRQGNSVVMSRWSDGAVEESWQVYKGQILDLVATPDGRGAWALGDQGVLLRLASGSTMPVQTVSLVLDGETADKMPNNATMVMSRDQSTAYVARRDGSLLKLAIGGNSGGSGKSTPPVLLAKFPESMFALALSPDGQTLALSFGSLQGASNKDVVLLNTRDGSEKLRLKGHSGVVAALAFSPDGRLLASAAQVDFQAIIMGDMKAVRTNESLRLWRVDDGSLLSSLRNERNVNGSPFLRGSLAFSAPPANAPDLGVRLVMTLWDEAARLYQLDDGKDNTRSLRLVQTLESRGLSPRQFSISDGAGRMLVSDGRPRVEREEVFLKAADIRREFGTDADWTAEREKRIQTLYGPRGLLSKVQRASMWDMKTGRLERIVDWQRASTTHLAVNAQGNFTSLAPLFPGTILMAPVRTNLVREATVDTQGQVKLRHFGYENWDGKPDDIFTALPASVTGITPTAPPIADAAKPAHAGSYHADIAVQSPSQRWTVVAGVPTGDKKDSANSQQSPRLFVQQRLADGTQHHRHDIAAPGLVRAMAISADERTLWVSGTAKGLPYNMDHQAWLLAINLADGQTTRQWTLAEGLTVDQIVAHPAGDMAITNGGTNLSIWDSRQAERKYFIKASDSLRAVKALALTADGKTIAAADTAGWTVLWDWPENTAPVPRWARQLASPSPHLLSFMAKGQRLAAGSSDGAIRLLAGADGSEIARMIRFDNDEWITITPEGYFVASQDGDRWVNVRMGNKVYGIDQFYDVFYRPDIVERRLAGQSITPLITVTLEDALRQPPPLVKLDLPTSGTLMAGQKVKIKLQALTQGGGVGEVRVMHNGKLLEVLNRAVVRSGLAKQPGTAAATTPALAAQVKNAAVAEETITRALRLAAQTGQAAVKATPPLQQLAGEVEVELVPGENSFSVIGFNTPGNLNARPVTRSITAQGNAPAPRVFVLAVGVNQFLSANAPTLKGAVKDSSDFVAALRDKLGESYRDAPVVVKMLHNEQASRAGLTAALDELQKTVRSNDLLVWFVASHGTLDNNAQYGVILQDWDGKLGDGSLFSTSNILEASRRIKAFNQFVILDTCHAGGVNSLVRGLYDARLAVLARNMGLHVFASAADTEEAIDSYRGNGLFTHTLLKGLGTSLADKNGDKLVTINELGEFARRETMMIARSVGHSQEPLLMNFGKDITLYGLK